jgi:hypothetical protein
MQTATFGGAKYFITFIDDYSRFITILFLKYKSKFLKIFKYSKPWCKIKLNKYKNFFEKIMVVNFLVKSFNNFVK